MFKKSSVIIYGVLIVSLLFVFIQHLNIKRIESSFSVLLNQQVGLENYVSSSFNVMWQEQENEAIQLALSMLADSCYVVYLPAGLCRSCFTTLLFAFQDHNVDFNKITVLSEANDPEIRSACNARGILFHVLDTSLNGITDIIVTRLYHGYLPLAVKYNLERDRIFALFISDNSKFLPFDDSL